jgi:Protein of unknown function (DUF3147)
MRISFDFAALNRTTFHQYAVRFLFGGAVTVCTGLIAKQYGPVFGGLFLAFPAIFPASATLVEKHEVQKKKRAGIVATRAGKQAAALDASGAAQGSLALVSFALIVWKLLPRTTAPLALLLGTSAWLVTAVAIWRLRKSHLWPRTGHR